MSVAVAKVEPSLWSRILDEGINPNLERMVKLWNAGRIAVLFFEVDVAGLDDYAKYGVASCGWNGERIKLAPMTKQGRSRWGNAIGCAYEGHKAVARWLRRSNVHGARLVVFAPDGVRCLNFDPAEGFTKEPGT